MTQASGPGLVQRIMALGSASGQRVTRVSQDGVEEELIHRDISLGRHLRPIPCYSKNRGDQPPLTFAFTSNNIHSPAAIQVASTMDHSTDPDHQCECTGPCDSEDCNCVKRTSFQPYKKTGKHAESKVLSAFDFETEIFECNSNCTCKQSKCQNRLVQFQSKYPFEVFRTEKHGWGLRSPVDLPAGAYLGEYTGRLITEDEFNYEIEDDSYCFDCGAHSKFTIDGRLYGNHLRFVNHSCKPNVRFAYVYVNPYLQYPRVCFFTIRDVPAGEELVLDYGPYYRPFLYMARGLACDCELPDCMYSAEVIKSAIERGDRWWEHGWGENAEENMEEDEAGDEETALEESEDEAEESRTDSYTDDSEDVSQRDPDV